MKRIGLTILLAGIVFLQACDPDYTAFGQCLTENGATFYGAFWCPHCTDQKTLLGNGMKTVKYVECSLPDKSGQTEICKRDNIEGYPTWQFKDGIRVSGVLQLETLAEKSGCELPK